MVVPHRWPMLSFRICSAALLSVGFLFPVICCLLFCSPSLSLSLVCLCLLRESHSISSWPGTCYVLEMILLSQLLPEAVLPRKVLFYSQVLGGSVVRVLALHT